MLNTTLATMGTQELHSTLCNAASVARSIEQNVNQIQQQRRACQVDKKWNAFLKAQKMPRFIVHVCIVCLFAGLFIGVALLVFKSNIVTFIIDAFLGIALLAWISLGKSRRVKKAAKNYESSALAYGSAITSNYREFQNASYLWCENYNALIPDSYQSSDVLYTLAGYLEHGLASTWQDCCKCFDSDQKHQELQSTIKKAAAAVAAANMIAAHTAASRVVNAVNTNTAAVNTNTAAVNTNTAAVNTNTRAVRQVRDAIRNL